ncbi:MAG: 50S ribosomal protein L25 [Deltaproteobacteria bacterium]|nr:50S ribosomal protein L25 [Deltaproteobacteria bacterium]MBW2051825.1 50S ribosomal protein L25 [Deltaproteobacteria bacterium]MBW2140692.1 50S ribosomal protein L25 [Deltaproteobacteria bacterium]MBW2322437.1 50S ribosomal protein L25 [Deltaproteobacteria bacterium]
MKTNLTINATVRTPQKKGQNRRLRSQGFVPAIFYGPNREAQALTVRASELKNALSSAQDSRFLIRLLVKDNGSSQESMIMIKDYQVDPVRREVLHIDFYEVDLNRPIQVEVSVNLVGKPIGLDSGGLLQQIRRTLLVSALPSEIPDEIVVDVSNLDNGQSIHVSDIECPSGVEAVTDGAITIAIVAPPKGVIEEEVEVEEELAEEGAAEEVAAETSEDTSASEKSKSED